ncbi:MAG: hypothetical protein JXO51_04660 [Candidatus Aminicenantes bacterium]|nr:hypothetical protein [Candidatus Aminicenantes bacterium]
MTEVTYFEDFHCYEYHTLQDASQRFRYCLYAPVYESILVAGHCTTQWEYPREKAVYSSGFLPCRLVRHFEDS